MEKNSAIEDETVGWHHRLNGLSLSKLRGIVKERGAWHAAVHGITKSWSRLSRWTTKCSLSVALGFHFYWVTMPNICCSLHRLSVAFHTPCCSNAPCYRSSTSNPNYITSSSSSPTQVIHTTTSPLCRHKKHSKHQIKFPLFPGASNWEVSF